MIFLSFAFFLNLDHLSMVSFVYYFSITWQQTKFRTDIQISTLVFWFSVISIFLDFPHYSSLLYVLTWFTGPPKKDSAKIRTVDLLRRSPRQYPLDHAASHHLHSLLKHFFLPSILSFLLSVKFIQYHHTVPQVKFELGLKY